jgi:hypothetical protein
MTKTMQGNRWARLWRALVILTTVSLSASGCGDDDTGNGGAQVSDTNAGVAPGGSTSG